MRHGLGQHSDLACMRTAVLELAAELMAYAGARIMIFQKAVRDVGALMGLESSESTGTEREA